MVASPLWFGLSSVAMLFLAGGGLDIARSYNQKVSVQGAADAAALAGAGAYTSSTQADAATAVANLYMANFKATSGITSLTYQATPSFVQQNGTVGLFKMTVTAQSTITNTLMRMASQTNSIGVSATAQNPVYNIKISMSGFSSSAIDSNSISWYVVPPDGSVPTVTTPLYTNTGTGPSSGALVISTTASQKIGFMLTNVTDGNATASVCTVFIIFKNCTQGNDYGSNQYGGQSKSVHYFYSHMMPPSKLAYPGVSQNCSLQVVVDASTKPTAGCTTSLPAYATVNCVQASGKVLHFWWNDMGGTTDDKDYDDAAYTVACAQVGTGPQGLALTN